MAEDYTNLVTEVHLRQLLDNVSESTLRRWRKLGMPVHKIGRLKRYNYDDVMDWIKKVTETGGDNI